MRSVFVKGLLFPIVLLLLATSTEATTESSKTQNTNTGAVKIAEVAANFSRIYEVVLFESRRCKPNLNVNVPTYKPLLQDISSYTIDKTSLIDNVNYQLLFGNSSLAEPIGVWNGIDTWQSPSPVPSSNAVLFEYQFQLPVGFIFGTGGRLPGVTAGAYDCSLATAGSGCWSVALGWRSKGRAFLVTRLPAASIPALGPGATTSGNDIVVPLLWNITAGGMHTVRLLVDTGSPGASDGSIKVDINQTAILDLTNVPIISSGASPVKVNAVQLKVAYTGTIPRSRQRIGSLTGTQLFNAIPPPKVYQWVDLTGDQKRRMLSLTSIFENAQTDLQYGYCENLHDGRGYTFGYTGFTTANDDGYALAKEYERRNSTNLLVPFLPELYNLMRKGNSSTKGLVGFCSAVAASVSDKNFRASQEYITNKLYYFPAMQWANDLGIRYPITKGQIYDATVNHGLGYSDWFSADHIFEGANAAMGGSPKDGVDEIAWLKAFMTKRKEMLLKESGGWSGSTKRVQMYEKLLAAGNLFLEGPIFIETTLQPTGWTIVDVYYGTFKIYTAQPGSKLREVL